MTTPNGHPQTPDDVQATMAQWEQMLFHLTKRNEKALTALTQSGVVIKQETLAHAQIVSLADSVAEAMGPAGPQFRLMTKVRWQQALGKILDEIGQQAPKANIALGGTMSASQIADLAKKTGTPGWDTSR